MSDFLLWLSMSYCENNHEKLEIIVLINFYVLLMLSSTVEVLVTLTSDVGRIMSKMHLVQPNGNINLVTGIRIAHVSLHIFECFNKISVNKNCYYSSS